MQEIQVRSMGREDHLKKGMATHSTILLLGDPMDRGSWWVAVHGVAKHLTRWSG